MEDLIKMSQSINDTIKNSAVTKVLENQKWLDQITSNYKLPDILKHQAWFDQVMSGNMKVLNQPAIALFNKIPTVFQNNNYLSYFQQLDKIRINLGMSSEMSTILNSFQSYDFDFAKYIEGFDDVEEQESPIQKIIFDEAARIKQLLFEIYVNNQKLFSLHPREFEKLVAELLQNKGFDVELTQQTRDNGYDILALRYINGFSPIKYLVECKRYKEERKVGVEIVRSFKEVITTEHANKGIIVTTSYFTRDAVKKQQETPLLLDYTDKDTLIGWIKEYCTK